MSWCDQVVRSQKETDNTPNQFSLYSDTGCQMFCDAPAPSHYPQNMEESDLTEEKVLISLNVQIIWSKIGPTDHQCSN